MSCKHLCRIGINTFVFVHMLESGPFIHWTYFHRIRPIATLESHLSLFRDLISGWLTSTLSQTMNRFLVKTQCVEACEISTFVYGPIDYCSVVVTSIQMASKLFLRYKQGFHGFSMLSKMLWWRPQSRWRFNRQVVMTLFVKYRQFAIRHCSMAPRVIDTFNWHPHWNRSPRLFICPWPVGRSRSDCYSNWIICYIKSLYAIGVSTLSAFPLRYYQACFIHVNFLWTSAKFLRMVSFFFRVIHC